MSDDRDRSVTEHLERLTAPPSRPGFHEELWERVQAKEHAAATRWRRTSIALAAVAVVAVAAAAALAAARGSRSSGVIDETFSCATTLQGQRPLVWVLANVRTRLSPVAAVQVLTTAHAFTIIGGVVQPQAPQLSFAAAKDSFAVDRPTCLPSHRSVPLAPSGLAASSTITPTFIGAVREGCVIAPYAKTDRVLVHVRLKLSGGVPTQAELAIRNEVTGKPVAYMVWTPTRLTRFLAATCKEPG